MGGGDGSCDGGGGAGGFGTDIVSGDGCGGGGGSKSGHGGIFRVMMVEMMTAVLVAVETMKMTPGGGWGSS